MTARLLLPASDADEAGTRARLDQLERRMAAGPVHAGSPPAHDAHPPTPPVRPVVESPPEPAAVLAPPKRLSDVAPSTAVTSSPDSATATSARDSAAAARPKPPTRPQPRADESSAEPAAAEPSTSPPPVESPGVTLDQFVSLWPAVLDAVKAYSKVAWMTFSTSAPISLSGGVLAVAVDDAGKVNNVKASGHDERLRQAILDVMKTDVRIDVVLAPDRSGIPARPASADAAAAAPEPDAPSLDDANADGAVGIDLALRELGATRIGEIEH